MSIVSDSRHAGLEAKSWKLYKLRIALEGPDENFASYH